MTWYACALTPLSTPVRISTGMASVASASSATSTNATSSGREQRPDQLLEREVRVERAGGFLVDVGHVVGGWQLIDGGQQLRGGRHARHRVGHRAATAETGPARATAGDSATAATDRWRARCSAGRLARHRPAPVRGTGPTAMA